MEDSLLFPRKIEKIKKMKKRARKGEDANKR